GGVADGEVLAVGAEGHGVAAGEGMEFPSRGCIPQGNRGVEALHRETFQPQSLEAVVRTCPGARGGDPPTIGTELDALGASLVTAQLEKVPPGEGIPDPHGFVPAGRGDLLPVRTERHPADVSLTAGRAKFVAGREVPDGDAPGLVPLAPLGNQ